MNNTSFLPAVVTIVDLTPATTVSAAALFEAVQTTAGSVESVSVSLLQIVAAVVTALPHPLGIVVVPPATTAIPATVGAVQLNFSTTGAVTLPLSASWAAVATTVGVYELSLFDVSGSASTNNVTINFSGGQTASGQASLSVATDYGGWRLQPILSGGWVVV